MTRVEALEGRDSVRSMLLVRNGVEHDARVLRAARVAERELGGRTLVVGVAGACPPGVRTVEGVEVVLLAIRPPTFAHGSWSAPRSGFELLRQLVGKHRVNPDSPEPSLDGGRALQRTQPARAPLSPGGRARRIISGASFALQALLLARRERPKLVHANDWNTMWSGLAIKLACGSRLVYDSHELWADRNGRWEWRPWLLASEALFVRMADEVVTTSPGHAEVLATRYRIPIPKIVRNIPEHGFTDGVARSSQGIGEHNGGVSLPHRIVYIGGLMPGRGLEQTIDALTFAPEVYLRAVGPGTTAYRMSLLARARSEGVERRVELCEPVAPGEVRHALAGAAAGLCLIQPICRSYELCLPNKLFEYAAAGVPILASDAPVIATLVRGEGLGEVVLANDPEAIAAGLVRLCEPTAWNGAAVRTRSFATRHTWERESEGLCEVYVRAMTRPGNDSAVRRFDARNDRTPDSLIVHSAPRGDQ